MMLPSGKGTYVLILCLAEPVRLEIGKLGGFDFPPGWYTYAGSAFGAGGLRGRLNHHLSPVRKSHWHIDYLRQSAHLKEIWMIASEIVHEHEWATVLHRIPGVTVPAAHFGSSDCTCQTHLFHFSEQPDFDQFCLQIGLNKLMKFPVNTPKQW